MGAGSMVQRVQPNALLESIRGVLAEADAARLSDRDLLQRFTARQDQVAFKAILRRHGPMVLRVCQRLLKQQEDAEDVFQATFLVLARKADSLEWRESVGAWLYEVAHRLAQGARRRQLALQAREAKARRPSSAEDPLTEISGRELVTILEEELALLPERYRAPLLLCGLEGKSGDEAAHYLGCSLSTLKRRLRQGRELLESQLNRRGFALSGALAALLLPNSASSSSVPPTLATMTAQAASFLAAGKPLPAGLASAQAVAIAGSMTRPLLWTKLMLILITCVMGGGLVAGTCALGRQNTAAASAESNADGVADPVLPDGKWRARAAEQSRASAPAAATVETTLRTASDHIRQFAFDGEADTFFASAQNAGSTDHFTLLFDRPVWVKSVSVATGRPQSGDRLDAGVLEVSADGKTFTELAPFAAGAARGEPQGRQLRAVRIRPSADLRHPLAVREFTIESDPPVAIFKYPVEFAVDVSAAPEMREWAENAARICERAFPMINEELKGDGFKPGRVITIALDNAYEDTAAKAAGGRITGSVKHFKAHPDDVGALIHTTVYFVQRYPFGWNPPWLEQGIADYVRFFKYEPGKLAPLDLDRTRYDAGYKVTAAFLAYLTHKYDREIVRKLNQIMREGEYREEAFKVLTGKTVQDLGEEWRASLRRDAGARPGSASLPQARRSAGLIPLQYF
jgi:RNA polymerase sigma factor (sigma-70 family)